jgi:hypothetical protein
MILSILISTLSDNLVAHAVGCSTARSLWLSLEKMISSHSQAHTMQMHYQLATLKKGSASIANYYQRMKTLNDTLAAMGQPLKDFEAVSYLLYGLGSEYNPLVTSITTRVDPLTLDNIYSHLLAHKLHVEQHFPAADLPLPSSNVSARSPSNCGKTICFPASGQGNSFGGRGSRGHGSFYYGRGCGSSSSGSNSNQPRVVCQVCNRSGHSVLHCYRCFDQFPSQHKGPSNPQAFYSSPDLRDDESWYTDTVATNHITNDMNNLNLTAEEYARSDQV